MQEITSIKIEIEFIDKKYDTVKRGNIYFFHKSMSFFNYMENLWSLYKEIKRFRNS